MAAQTLHPLFAELLRPYAPSLLALPKPSEPTAEQLATIRRAVSAGAVSKLPSALYGIWWTNPEFDTPVEDEGGEDA